MHPTVQTKFNARGYNRVYPEPCGVHVAVEDKFISHEKVHINYICKFDFNNNVLRAISYERKK